MSNHYHIIAQAPERGDDLTALIRALHSRTAKAVNASDGVSGRRVWHQFWDTLLTSERSYLARLSYVNRNPATHGLVERAEDYPWCSMRQFMHTAPESFQRTLAQIPIDRVKVPDDF